ncbi:MAG: hypothetical protein HKO64_06170, partial [Xanthomonadales bacterium]|nr:hypothetical protein [Xanthomonadales bacterium]
VSKLNSSFANLELTEIGLLNDNESLQVAGGGTGREVAGGGTGKEVAGGGTGKEVAGGGTGILVAGGGTGILVAGGGTGVRVAGGGTGILVAGGGTGVNVAGGGTGADASAGETGRKYWADGDETLLIAGGGTGSDAIKITLPGGTDMQMEVSLGCNSADVTIFDANFVEVVAFNGVPAIGASSYCNSDVADYPLLARNFDIPGDFERDR